MTMSPMVVQYLASMMSHDRIQLANDGGGSAIRIPVVCLLSMSPATSRCPMEYGMWCMMYSPLRYLV